MRSAVTAPDRVVEAKECETVKMLAATFEKARKEEVLGLRLDQGLKELLGVVSKTKKHWN